MITNLSLSGLFLKKKHNSLVYYPCREASSVGMVSYIHYFLSLNKNDCLTKALQPVFFLQNTSFSHLWPSHHIENDEESQEKIPSDSDVVTIIKNSGMRVLLDHS